MRDVVVVLVIAAFFALATAYVRACASMVGSETGEAGGHGEDESTAELAS